MSRGDNLGQRPDGKWEGQDYQDGRRKSVYAPTFNEARRSSGTQRLPPNAANGLPNHRRVARVLAGYVCSVPPPAADHCLLRGHGRAWCCVPAIGKVPVAKLTIDDVAAMLRKASRRARAGAL